MKYRRDPIDSGETTPAENAMQNASIRMICPNLRCRTLLAVPITARGKTVRCRQCGTRIGVPASSGKATKPAATADAGQGGAEKAE